MAQDDLIALPADTWTEITNSNTAEITAFNRTSDVEVIIQATDGNPPENADRKGIPILKGDSRFIKVPITDLSFLDGVVRVFAFAVDNPASLYVQTSDAP